jgi:hypothetical protein
MNSNGNSPNDSGEGGLLQGNGSQRTTIIETEKRGRRYDRTELRFVLALLFSIPVALNIQNKKCSLRSPPLQNLELYLANESLPAIGEH